MALPADKPKPVVINSGVQARGTESHVPEESSVREKSAEDPSVRANSPDDSSVREKSFDDSAPEDSSVRQKSSDDTLAGAMRAALELARMAGTPVKVALRGDPTRGIPLRFIEGNVVEFTTLGDGRERVVLSVAEDTSQVILVERIVRVMSTD